MNRLRQLYGIWIHDLFLMPSFFFNLLSLLAFDMDPLAVYKKAVVKKVPNSRPISH